MRRYTQVKRDINGGDTGEVKHVKGNIEEGRYRRERDMGERGENRGKKHT